uniref:Prolyl 4-hydroxylase alpha subunit Fe(2+) 2OG dioxygenase domain-containing protein n=1 Tax=Prymnesium polylepis TaxID=72548 RepID=A0A7S4J6X4_9EUKA
MSVLLAVSVWAAGGGPAVLYFCATIYVDLNMWRQSLVTPPVAAADPLTAFVWHDESANGTVNLRPHLAAHATYRQHEPFPHTAIDGMVPLDLLEKVIEELPEHLGADGCAEGSTACYVDPLQFRKTEIARDDHMGPYTRRVFAALRSRPFIAFLEELTGIHGLHPDPGYEGSGVHLTGTGGHLNIHADFNHLSMSPTWHRRVNTFIYLNKNWPDHYGGHLELWNRNLTACVQRIRPDFGRFVAFSTTDFSYHGHPQPMQIPETRMRRSIAMYYYTRGDRSEADCLKGSCTSMHSTIFKTPQGCAVCEQPACARFRDDAA